MELKNYNNIYIDELNAWQKEEERIGLNSLNKFVVVEGELLGDYLDFIAQEMQSQILLAFVEGALVGFVCYEEKEKGHYHVEIMGVSPKERGKGHSKQILTTLKNLLMQDKDFKTLTLSVNVKNIAGQKAFDKIGKNIGLSENENYFEYQL